MVHALYVLLKMNITRRRICLAIAVVLLVWAIYGRVSYYPQVNVDWQTTADINRGRGFFVATGRLWGKQDIFFRRTKTEWVPLFLVVSDFELENAHTLEGGCGGNSDVGFNFSDRWIEVPIDADVPSFSHPNQPDRPNVFILHEDNTIEITDLTVRTQEQLNRIPYKLRGKQTFSEIRHFLQSQLQNPKGESGPRE